MPINYQSDTSPIYAGRFGPPAWVVNAPLNQYVTIPLSVTLPDLDPKDNVLINPNYPADPEWDGNGHSSVVTAWCGGTKNTDGTKFYMPLSGGHADYAGNEPYSIDFMSEAPEFKMLRYPSGAIGNLLTTNDGQEATGVYSDGRVRAIHSYDKPVYVDGVGPFITLQGGVSWSAVVGPNNTLSLNVETGETTILDASDMTGGTSGSASCYDPSRHRIWYHAANTGKTAFYDVATDTWDTTSLASKAWGNETTAQYIPAHDVIIFINAQEANGFAIYDCDTDTYYNPSLSGSFVGLTLTGGVKPALVEHLGYVALWDNTTDTTMINKMVIPTDPRTDAWVVSQLTVDVGNSITPDPSTRLAVATKGTYGRFFYSTTFKGFLLYADYLSDWLFFKIED